MTTSPASDDLDALATTIIDGVVRRLLPVLTRNADHGDEEMLDEAAAARILAVQPSTLAAWRSRGGGPRYIKVGNKPRSPVRYQRGALHDFLAARHHAHTGHRLGVDDDSAGKAS